MTARNLLEWFIAEHNVETPGGERWCYNTLQRGATIIEDGAFNHPTSKDVLIGRSAYLMRYQPSAIENEAQAIGYALEKDDHIMSAIALRRQTSRGH